MASLRKDLTDIVVRGTKAPATGQIDIFDRALRSFGVRISAKGARTFFLMYWIGDGESVRDERGRVVGGRRLRRMTIGDARLMKLGEARERAMKALRLVKEGTDPQDKPDHPFVPTFREVLERYLGQYANRELRARTAEGLRRGFEHDALPAWGERPIDAIQPRDVVSLVDGIAERGARIGANRHFAALRAFFNWAVAKQIITRSPCDGLEPPTRERPGGRERVLSEDEVRLFWAGSEVIGDSFRDIFRLLLVTAQRRDEVGQMRWKEVDLEKRVWTIPAERTKNGKAHEVALSSLAVDIISRQPRSRYFVFPSRANEGKTAVSGYSKAKLRLDAAMGDVDPFILHDLRRTAATQMAEIGIAAQVVDKALNHKSGTIRGVAAVYNRYEYRKEVREALLAWGERLRAIVGAAENAPEAPRLPDVAE